MSWRVARSLLTLREQINTRYPDRDRTSDGTIGDADHQNRNSDHNPWCGPGVVTAMDITHDPAHGVDIDRLTDELQASRDPRIKYVIANRFIMSGNGGPAPWDWRTYDGPNPHTRHFHLSVVCSASKDDTRPWNLPSLKRTPQPEEDDMSGKGDEIYKLLTDTLTITMPDGTKKQITPRQAFDYLQERTLRVEDKLDEVLAELRKEGTP